MQAVSWKLRSHKQSLCLFRHVSAGVWWELYHIFEVLVGKSHEKRPSSRRLSSTFSFLPFLFLSFLVLSVSSFLPFFLSFFLSFSCHLVRLETVCPNAITVMLFIQKLVLMLIYSIKTLYFVLLSSTEVLK
jgi:hypothetical protein